MIMALIIVVPVLAGWVYSGGQAHRLSWWKEDRS